MGKHLEHASVEYGFVERIFPLTVFVDELVFITSSGVDATIPIRRRPYDGKMRQGVSPPSMKSD